MLLLNSVLTVEMGRAASHRDRGWERFTDAVIREVNARQDPVVFMLWGSYAQKKASFVDASSPPRAEGAAPVAAVGAQRLSSAAGISPRPMLSWKAGASLRSTGRCPNVR